MDEAPLKKTSRADVIPARVQAEETRGARVKGESKAERRIFLYKEANEIRQSRN
jgi:hypothetical protein